MRPPSFPLPSPPGDPVRGRGPPVPPVVTPPPGGGVNPLRRRPRLLRRPSQGGRGRPRRPLQRGRRRRVSELMDTVS